jgi:hypothetical protein
MLFFVFSLTHFSEDSSIGAVAPRRYSGMREDYMIERGGRRFVLYAGFWRRRTHGG